MASKKTFGSTKRFGARYGRRTRHRLAEIEQEQRKKHRCIYCHALKVKRIAVGIWNCEKCGSKFTGKAYTVSKKSAGKSQKEEDVIPEISVSLKKEMASKTADEKEEA